jgi:hypothetical protein
MCRLGPVNYDRALAAPLGWKNRFGRAPRLDHSLPRSAGLGHKAFGHETSYSRVADCAWLSHRAPDNPLGLKNMTRSKQLWNGSLRTVRVSRSGEEDALECYFPLLCRVSAAPAPEAFDRQPA